MNLLKKFLWLLVLTYPVGLFAQDLQIEPTFGDSWVSRNESIGLNLNRPLAPDDGKLAIFVGPTDMTDLFLQQENSFNYTPAILMLPSGETEVVVHLVSPEGEWQEMARFPLKVLSRAGFEKAEVVSKVSINNSGQIAEGHSPVDNQPARDTYQDFTGQANITSEHIRDGVSIRSQWDFVGASEQEQALRFGEKGEDAAQIDLSSYQFQLQTKPTDIRIGQTTKPGRLEFALGQVSHGRQRHLFNSFSSRGVTMKADWGSTVDFSFAAMNANSIVGWSNFTGLSRSRNRIYSGTIGAELLNRPGGLRIEGSFLKGSSLPLSDFNQGNINDAEESRGYGITLRFSDGPQRIQFEGGFARSKYTNPEDELLSQGTDLVPVKEESKNARYADVNLGVLPNFSISENWQGSLSLNLRHERVDPLYRSMGASARADYLENAFGLQSNIGMIGMQLSHSRSEDNLDNVPSILKTKTRTTGLNLNIPLNSIFLAPTGSPFPWMPMISYSYNRTHQFGDELPSDGGFSDGHVPDQVTKGHNTGLDWSGGVWRAGYRLTYSLQDNRQPGREKADFRNLNNAFSFGLTPVSILDVSVELSFDKLENKELERTDSTTNFGLSLNMRTTRRSTLNANFTTTRSEDNAKTTSNKNLNLNVQWSHSFNLRRSLDRQLLQGQVFIRYTRVKNESEDSVFDFSSDLSNWTINTGVNVSLF